MVVDARCAGLSILENDDLLEFSHTPISRVYRECPEKEDIQRAAALWGGEWPDWFELMKRQQHTTRQTFQQKTHWVTILSDKNRKLRLQFTQGYKNWPIKDWINVACSDEPQVSVTFRWWG